MRQWSRNADVNAQFARLILYLFIYSFLGLTLSFICCQGGRPTSGGGAGPSFSAQPTSSLLASRLQQPPIRMHGGSGGGGAPHVGPRPPPTAGAGAGPPPRAYASSMYGMQQGAAGPSRGSGAGGGGGVGVSGFGAGPSQRPVAFPQIFSLAPQELNQPWSRKMVAAAEQLLGNNLDAYRDYVLQAKASRPVSGRESAAPRLSRAVPLFPIPALIMYFEKHCIKPHKRFGR